jgi:hypothetical protein
VVTHFDTEALGILDVEGIEVDQATGDVYFIGSPRNRLAQFSRDGRVLRLFDISDAHKEPNHPSYKPAGLALGVSSVNPALMNMYIADRGSIMAPMDENDGRVYECPCRLPHRATRRR